MPRSHQDTKAEPLSQETVCRKPFIQNKCHLFFSKRQSRHCNQASYVGPDCVRAFASDNAQSRCSIVISGYLTPFFFLRTLTVFIACLLSLPGCATGMRGNATTIQAAQAKERGLPVEKVFAKSGIVLRFIPAGTFLMGSAISEQAAIASEGDERALLDVPSETQHNVTITKPFYIGKYEVTLGQWKKVMGTDPIPDMDVGENAPVGAVTWTECQEFLMKLTTLERIPGGSFRLPTEAEWEYACRAGTTTRYYTGNDERDLACAGWYGGNSDNDVSSVGLKEANAWGLYDMHGSVWEWCQDWHAAYEGSAADPMGPEKGTERVARGGAWIEAAARCRSAHRDYYPPEAAHESLGFRIVLSESAAGSGCN